MNLNATDITKTSKYFLYIAVLFSAVLLISNTVAVKLVQIGPYVFTGAIFIFPISYIFGDILTEVYGYAATRKVIWLGLACQVLMALCYLLVQILPAVSFWPHQASYDAILGYVPRIVVASMVGYLIGEFVNSALLSKMKVWTNGKHLWTRTIGSTLVGQGVDSIIFYVLAFAGTIPVGSLVPLIVAGYAAKVVFEVLITPVTYIVVKQLKRAEGIDTYDSGISYNPFRIS